MNAPPESTPPQPPSRPLVLASASAGLLVGIALLATSPMLPMGWDEGNAIVRAQAIERWVGGILTCGVRSPHPLSEEGIQEHWRYTTRIEGHPALYGIVIAAGRWASLGWLGPLESYRLGPIVLFALAAASMFYRMGRDYSMAAAVASLAALVVLPRMFAHAHFAGLDGPLVACWVLAWAAFEPARRSRRGIVLFGLGLGMTLSAKATGWIAPLPLAAWALLYRDRAAARALGWGVPIALGTFFLLNPPLWHHPIQGWATFVEMNLGRGRFNIPTQFFGRMYDLGHPLPWYNTLVWTAITVPVGILLLMLVGLAAAVRRWRVDRAGTLLAANAAALMVVRALPGVPPHDAERLFLPSFAFLAALAGIGSHCVFRLRLRDRCTLREKAAQSPLSLREKAAQNPLSLWERVRVRVLCPAVPRSGPLPQPFPKGRRGLAGCCLPSGPALATATVVLLYLGSLSSLIWYAPQWLSYYNLLIGGLRGATALGMEPTYYWDALDRDVLGWLGEHTSPDEKVQFGAPSIENLTLMRSWGTLPVEFRADAPGTYRWYVVQHRPSAWQPADRRLIEQGQASYRKIIHSFGRGPWRLDVPLVLVYPYQRYLEVVRTTGASRSSGGLAVERSDRPTPRAGGWLQRPGKAEASSSPAARAGGLASLDREPLGGTIDPPPTAGTIDALSGSGYRCYSAAPHGPARRDLQTLTDGSI